VRFTSQARPAASLYAMVRSDCACAATASAAWIGPFTVPGGNPVTAEPGLTPRSPFTTEGPVLVTVEPASTAKLLAVPRPTGDGPAFAVRGLRTSTPQARTSMMLVSDLAVHVLSMRLPSSFVLGVFGARLACLKLFALIAKFFRIAPS
jgi:hypothetical protein